MKKINTMVVIFIGFFCLFNLVACNELDRLGGKITENPYNITDTVIVSKISRSQLGENYFCIIDDVIHACWYDDNNDLRSRWLPTKIMPEGLSNFRFCRAESGLYDSQHGSLFSFYATFEEKEKRFLVGGKVGMFGNQYKIKEYPVEDVEGSFNYFEEEDGNIYKLLQNERILLIKNAKLLDYISMNDEKDKFWILYKQGEQNKLSVVNKENVIENTINFDIDVLKIGTISVRDKSSTEIRQSNKFVYFCSEKAVYLYDQENTLFNKIDIDTKLYGISASITDDAFTLNIAKKKGDIFEVIDKEFSLQT